MPTSEQLKESQKNSFANFTQGWLPTKSVQVGTVNGQPQYHYIFNTEGTITRWMLRKAIYWLFPLSFGPNLESHGGAFEYKIFDPSGNLLMWSRVNLCMNIITQDLFYTWYQAPDRTDALTPKVINAPVSQVSKIAIPELPTVRQVKNASGVYQNEFLITYNGEAPLVTGNGIITKTNAETLVVQKAHYISDLKTLGSWLDIGTMTLDAEAQKYTFIDNSNTIKAGEEYYYRIKATHSLYGFTLGPGISVVMLNKSVCRTYIETYVIDNKRTTLFDTLEPNRIKQDEISTLAQGTVKADDYVFWPKKEEQLFLLNPADGFGFQTPPVPLDTNAYLCAYEMDIPSGSRLVTVFDGFNRGVAGRRGKNSGWQFKFVTEVDEGVMWGVIKTLGGKMLSTQVKDTGIHIVRGDNPNSLTDVNSDRSYIVFPNGNSAFIYATKSGKIYVGTNEKGKNYLYVSKNQGTTFKQLESSPEVPLQLFQGDTQYRIIDMAKIKNETIVLLAENKTGLFIQKSSDFYDEIIFVGNKAPKNTSYVLDASSPDIGSNDLKIIGNNQTFISRNAGKTWK